MALWVDKYRPRRLDKLDFHPVINRQLSILANTSDFPHLLVYGPSGSGKKTRVHAVLVQLFGAGVEKLSINARIFTTPSNRKIEIFIVSSNYHSELVPSDAGNQDKMVIQEIVKELAQTQQIDQSAQKRFKVVIIKEADSLSRDAQAALRRTMEKYMANLRVILICNSTSRIISPIKSRCLLMRMASPSPEEVLPTEFKNNTAPHVINGMKKIMDVLHKVGKKEGFRIPETLAARIALESNRNLRKAILMLEALKVSAGSTLADDTPVIKSDWEQYLSLVTKSILREQSPKNLLTVRSQFYELQVHCIPAPVILKTLAFELIQLVDDNIKPQIVACAADYEHKLRLGSKPIYHLEAFVAKFMSIYKRFLISCMG